MKQSLLAILDLFLWAGILGAVVGTAIFFAKTIANLAPG